MYCGSSIDSRLGRGLVRLETKDYDGAVEDFVIAENQWAGCLEPSLLKGRAYFASGKEARARAEFQRLYESATLKDEAVLGICAVLWLGGAESEGAAWAERCQSEIQRERLRAVFLNDRGRFEEARAAALRTLALNPKEVFGRGVLAWGYLHDNQGHVPEAERLYRELVRLRPDLALYHSMLSEALLVQHKVEESMGEARAAMCKDARLTNPHTLLGACLEELGQREEALKEFQEAARIDPGDSDVWNALGVFLASGSDPAQALKAFDRAIEIFPIFAWSHRYRGSVYESQGNLEAALADYLAADAGLPRDIVRMIHGDLERVLKKLGRLPEAVEQYAIDFRSFPRDPELHAALWQFLLCGEAMNADGEIGELASVLEEALKSDGDPSLIQRSLALVLSREGKAKNPERALRFMALARGDEAIQRSEDAVLFAEVKFACGQRGEAVRDLESALRTFTHRAQIGNRLAELRQLMLPDLASFGSVDAALARSGDQLGTFTGARLLEAFQPLANGEIGRAVLAYLEGRVLQLEGKHSEAAIAFEDLLSLEEPCDEPILRLAECLSAQSRFEEAEARLLEGLKKGLQPSSAIWFAWVKTCFVDLCRSPSEVLTVMPSTKEEDGPAAELRWLLDRLATGEPVRINCGGEEYRDPEGIVWGKDRFFVGGANAELSSIEIARTRAAPLYQTARVFRDIESRTTAYRVPLPKGTYEVALHFAETWHRRAGLRCFDVLLEGKEVLKGYEPFSAGFATAEVRTFNVGVSDGFLEIDLVPGVEHPTISAIQIIRVE